MLFYGQKVPTIAGDERIHFRLNRTGEDQIIGRVARHRLGWSLGCWHQFSRRIDEKLLDPSPALRLEAQLPGEDPLQLDHYRLRQDQLQASVDRLLDHPARRAGRDEGGDQDVGVAEDAQDQSRSERISSTSASESSGPIPRVSARSRP